MKVIQINVTANWGSTGRIVEDIGKEVIRRGGQSYVAYGRYKNVSSSSLIKIGTRWDGYFHGLQSVIGDRHGLGSVAPTYHLIKQINNICPDLIHLHNIPGYYINYPVLFKYLAAIDIPIVWTLHDCWAFTGHCVYFSYVNCQKWKTECQFCPQKRSYPQSLFVDRSKKNFWEKRHWFTSLGERLTLVPVSDWLADMVQQSFLKDCSFHRIYNGIDTNLFRPIVDSRKRINDKYCLHYKKLILGVANIWNVRKGLEDFVKLRSLLSDDYLIFLIGLSKRQIASLPNGIIGLERTDNLTQLVEIYSAADVYVNFSKEETFGLTTVESMSCGTPVLAYNATALPEIVSENTGVIVPIGDLEQAAIQVKEICKIGKEFYADCCRKRAVSLFKKEDSITEYLNLYENVLCQ